MRSLVILIWLCLVFGLIYETSGGSSGLGRARIQPDEGGGISRRSSLRCPAGVEAMDLSNNRFDPSLLDSIKHKVKLNLTGCA